MSILEPRSECRHGIPQCGLPTFEIDRDSDVERTGTIKYTVSVRWCRGCGEDLRLEAARRVLELACEKIAEVKGP